MPLESHTLHHFPPDRSILRLQPPLRGYHEGFPTFARTLERETDFHSAVKTLILTGGGHELGVRSTLPSDKRPELALCGLIKLLRPLRVLERVEIFDLDFVRCPFAIDPSHVCEEATTFRTVVVLVIDAVCMRQPWTTDIAALFPSLDTLVVGAFHYAPGGRSITPLQSELQQPLSRLTVCASAWTDVRARSWTQPRWALWRLPLNRQTEHLEFVGATVHDLPGLARLVNDDRSSLRRVRLDIAEGADAHDGRNWEALPLSLCPRLRRVEIRFPVDLLYVEDAPGDHPPLADDSDDDAPLEDQVPSNLLFAIIRAIPPWVRTVDVTVDLCGDSTMTEDLEDCAMSRVNWVDIGQWVATNLEGVILRMDVPDGFRTYMSMKLRALENREQLTVQTH